MTNPKEARGTTQQTQLTQKPQMLQAVPKLLPSQEVLLYQKLQLVQKYQTSSQRRRGQEHRTIRTLLKNCQNHKSPVDLPTIPTILQRQDQRSQRCQRLQTNQTVRRGSRLQCQTQQQSFQRGRLSREQAAIIRRKMRRAMITVEAMTRETVY